MIELFDQWCDQNCSFFDVRGYVVPCAFCDHYLDKEYDEDIENGNY